VDRRIYNEKAVYVDYKSPEFASRLYDALPFLDALMNTVADAPSTMRDGVEQVANETLMVLLVEVEITG